MLLKQRQKDRDVGLQTATLELDRWLRLKPLALNSTTHKDPDFLRK
jgi:hypothetical protein